MAEATPDERAGLVLLPPGRRAGLRLTARSYEDFYHEWWGRICMSVIASGLADRAAAEDLVQDAFEQALWKWDYVSLYDSPQAWVRKVAENRAIDRWRSRRMEVHEDPPDTASLDDATADAAMTEMALARALELIEHMSPRRRQVLTLRFVEGWTTDEVASMLGLTPETVRGHVLVGRRELQGLMDLPDREEPKLTDSSGNRRHLPSRFSPRHAGAAQPGHADHKATQR